MIAEPTAAWPSVPRENSSPGGVSNENRQKSTRGKRRAREGSENAKRRHSEPSLSSLAEPEYHHLKNENIEAVTLFEVVTMEKSAMQAVVADWTEAYRTDRETALLDLISFFIQCSGCKGVVTAEMFQCTQESDIMSKMVEELDEGSGLQFKKFLAFPWILTVTWPMDMDGGEYPLTMPGPYWKRFRSNFCEFLSMLVAQCQYSVLFDGYLMDTLISLLTELSDSGVRAFRHTCTLAAMKLLSALVVVALSLGASLDNSQRLYEVERLKASCRRGVLRLHRIQRKIEELQDKRLEVENMMDAIFKGVFLKRYRDVIAEIRAICMEELSVWMRLYTSMFLNNSYLKYIGWMLHDKQPEVRLKCVQGLQALYGDALLVSKLDLFTSRFKERMLSMALDKDHEVAVQAVRLLLIISKSCEDVLSADDCKNLYQLVFSSHRPLACIAGEFLYTRLLSGPAQVDGVQQDGHGDLSATRVRALIQFFRESELHEHVIYLVDSLWDSAASLLKDWTAFSSLLLQGLGLSSEQEGLVIEILLASVRQAAEGSALAGRGPGRKVVSAKERKTQLDDCVRLTQHFVAVLPALLSKFSGDADKVSCLLKIPQYFHTEASSTELPEKDLEALLAQMDAAMERHADAAVLEAGARTFQVLCCEDVRPWRSLALATRDELVQRWVVRLGVLLPHLLDPDRKASVGDEMSEDAMSTLRRIAAFHNAQDLSRWGVCDMASQLLGAELQDGGLPPQVTVQALRCVYYAVLWKLSTCTEMCINREEAFHQRDQLRGICERCHRFLSHAHPAVREQAFLSLCDLLTAHSYQLQAWDPAAGAPIRYTPDPRLQRALLGFILEHVFTGSEHENQSKGGQGDVLDQLHRRRNLLAAYCKLIVHGVLEMSMAADIFKFYVKFLYGSVLNSVTLMDDFRLLLQETLLRPNCLKMPYYNDFGDIIKEMLSRTRQIDKIESARTLVLCLQQLFLRLKQEQERGATCSSAVQTFSSIKELARRFSLTFGWDQIKSRESLAMIHRDGIEFVFQGCVQQAGREAPANLPYLTILSEFSSKLLKPDKKTVCAYLQRFAGEQVAGSREECWLPLGLYRASLLATAECDDGGSYVSGDTAHAPLRPIPTDGEAPGQTPEQKRDIRPKKTIRLDTGPDEQPDPQPPLGAREQDAAADASPRQLSPAAADVDVVDIDP